MRLLPPEDQLDTVHDLVEFAQQTVELLFALLGDAVILALALFSDERNAPLDQSLFLHPHQDQIERALEDRVASAAARSHLLRDAVAMHRLALI